MLRKKRAKQPGIIAFVRRNVSEFWRYLVTGLLVWVPLIITIWIAWFFVDKFVIGVERSIANGFALYNLWLNSAAESYAILEWLPELAYIRGSGFVLVLLLFATTGVLARYLVGQRIIRFGERVLQQIPLISRVYRAVVQIRDTFIGRKGAVFQKVCLIEYPRAGMVAVAFVTSRERGVVQQATGQTLVAVFVPTTPNPTSGYLVYLPPEEITELDISVEEAMKMIVSGGAYIPGKKHLPEPAETP